MNVEKKIRIEDFMMNSKVNEEKITKKTSGHHNSNNNKNRILSKILMI